MVELGLHHIDASNTQVYCDLGAGILGICPDDWYCGEHWSYLMKSNGKDQEKHAVDALPCA